MKHVLLIARWLAILPAAILATVVVALPIHLVVITTFTSGCGGEPIVEVKDASTLRAIELFLRAIFGPFAFVCAAALTAPVKRLAVSVAAGFTVVIGMTALAMWVNSLPGQHVSSFGVVTLIANAAGAVGAAFFVRHRIDSGELNS